MVLITTEGRFGAVSFNELGGVFVEEQSFPNIHLTIAALRLGNPQEITASEKLRNSFCSVLPSFNSAEALQQPVIEKIAEATEQNLRNLSFLKPVKKITTHPLKNKLTHVYKTEKDHQSLIETKLISTWLQFLQGKVEEKQDLSSLSYLILGHLIQVNYFIQVERLVSQLSLNLKYSDLQQAHGLLTTISSLLLNPHILYSQPYKQIVEKLQKKIASIQDPEISFYNSQYRVGIQEAIKDCLRDIRQVLDIDFVQEKLPEF